MNTLLRHKMSLDESFMGNCLGDPTTFYTALFKDQI